jgi:hypothetical protein
MHPYSCRERATLRQIYPPLLRAVALLVPVALGATPLAAATQNAPVTANASKPLVLTKLQNLDLGTVTLGPGTWSNAIVSVTRAGTFSCGSANLTCTGASTVAQYNVQGSNQQTVRISAPDVTLVNQTDPTQTLVMTVDSPGTILLTNSGFPGINFSLGGSVTLNSTTSGGTYVGTFNVTVDY